MRAPSILTALALATLSVSCLYGGRIGGPSSKQLQHRELAQERPAGLEVDKPWKGEPRVAKVRVYADDDFVAQNLHWKADIDEQIDDANQLLVPALGVRIEVAEMKPWPVRQTDRTLDQVLESLETLDPGDDVTWVIGYTSSLSLVSSNFEALGEARPLGHHLVIRGFADLQEREYFAKLMPKTTAAEREVILQARRRHKQTVILLHELGHTLGAPHETDEHWIMHGTYGKEMSQLSDQSRALMQLTLEEWLKPAAERDLRTLAGRLDGYIESNPWGGWVTDDLATEVAVLHQMADSAPTPGTGGGATAKDIPVPAGAYDQFKHAQSLARQGKPDDALAELEALVSAYPASAEIRQGICEVHIGKDGPGHADTAAACDRAAEISPDDPRPYSARIEAFLAANDQPSALAMLPRLEARAGEKVETWDRIAAIYEALGMVTRAERAAAHSVAASKSDTPHPVLAWATRTRARYGLPPDGRKWKISEDQEGEYVRTVRELLDLVYASKVSDAVAKAAAAQKRWKGAPGILAALCDLHLRQGDTALARNLCKQAVAAWPGTAWAQYLLGVLDYQDGHVKESIAALRTAIAADPELGQAYRALGKALTRAKDTAGRAALAADYAKRFGAPLPE